MGTIKDRPSDDVSDLLSQQMVQMKEQAQQEEEEARARQIRLLRARRSSLLDAFTDRSTTLGG